MTTAHEITAFERGIESVLQVVLSEKAEQVVSLQADTNLQKRIEELASKSTEGTLTNEEMAEYQGYVRANKFVAILQRQARRMLQSKP
ncbi:MAG: hypothetical protein WD030_05355 [Pirellulales bacterium]